MTQGLSALTPVFSHSYFHAVISIEWNILSTMYATSFPTNIPMQLTCLLINKEEEEGHVASPRSQQAT
jgi:hypothetical protein